MLVRQLSFIDEPLKEIHFKFLPKLDILDNISFREKLKFEEESFKDTSSLSMFGQEVIQLSMLSKDSK